MTVKKNNKLALSEIRKRNMLIACLQTPDCKPILKVVPHKDDFRADYVVTLTGKEPFVHASDLKLIRELDFVLERFYIENSKLCAIFVSKIVCECDDD